MARSPRIFHLLQKAHSALFRATDKRLRDAYGLTASQQGVLFVLSMKDGQPISAIAEALAMGKSSLTGLIDRMEEKSLVRRVPHPQDSRSHLVCIEPAGRDITAASLSQIRHLNDALLAPFTTAEQATIARFLTHVAENGADLINTAKATSLPETRP